MTNTHRYFAAPGATFTDDDAALLGARVSLLAESGEVTPERIVDDARPPDSPIHPLFEWDDAVAAERYRHGQATHYLTNIYVIRAEDKGALRMDRIVRSHRPTPPPLRLPSADPLQQAMADLARWRERYGSLQEVRPAAILVREALETLESLAARTHAMTAEQN